MTRVDYRNLGNYKHRNNNNKLLHSLFIDSKIISTFIVEHKLLTTTITRYFMI